LISAKAAAELSPSGSKSPFTKAGFHISTNVLMVVKSFAIIEDSSQDPPDNAE
jgi:hypothetical protein